MEILVSSGALRSAAKGERIDLASAHTNIFELKVIE
jgi:hypothetical protein